MKALILAAGRGTRISRYLEGNPKCTVNIGGTTLIRYTVELLRSYGIEDIAISVGYRKQAIFDALEGLPVRYFENPFFDVTNSIASAWFAKEFLADDEILIMNGDVYLDRAMMPLVLESAPQKTPLLFADDTRKEEADYKFMYRDGILLKYGKELTGDDITGEYIGVARLAKEFLPHFTKKLTEMIDAQQHSVWWENVLYALSDEKNVYVEGIGNNFWAEVDYVEDYERILSHRGFSISQIAPLVQSRRV